RDEALLVKPHRARVRSYGGGCAATGGRPQRPPLPSRLRWHSWLGFFEGLSGECTAVRGFQHFGIDRHT
ncbi:hypothetical protein, partial [Xanthomonas sp. WHRI 10204]|uniref:hypothetical protein n=1 Tax=Xanthomonas sp. WHRI 10204 TaxID=3161562 RepID=UPI0032E8B081